jgi:hypothetical protein
VDPVPDPLLSQNLVTPTIESGTSGSVSRKSDHYTIESVPLTYVTLVVKLSKNFS